MKIVMAVAVVALLSLSNVLDDDDNDQRVTPIYDEFLCGEIEMRKGRIDGVVRC